jgi:hypothetical protein
MESENIVTQIGASGRNHDFKTRNVGTKIFAYLCGLESKLSGGDEEEGLDMG